MVTTKFEVLVMKGSKYVLIWFYLLIRTAFSNIIISNYTSLSSVINSHTSGSLLIDTGFAFTAPITIKSTQSFNITGLNSNIYFSGSNTTSFFSNSGVLNLTNIVFKYGSSASSVLSSTGTLYIYSCTFHHNKISASTGLAVVYVSRGNYLFY